MKIRNIVRIVERKFENLGSGFYDSENHEKYYKNVMLFRSIIRKISGNELTNTIEQGKPLYEQIAKIAGYDGRQQVLDFGCGTAGVGYHFVNRLQPSGSYVGVDIFNGALAGAKERLSTTNKPFTLKLVMGSEEITGIGNFDIVIAQSVFTHCPINLFEDFLYNLRNVTHKDSKIVCNFAIGLEESNISKIDFIYRRSTVEESISRMNYNFSEVSDWIHPVNDQRLETQPKDCCFLITPK